MKFRLLAIILIITGLALKSCKKDPEIVISEDFKTTPYILERRAWYPQFDLPADNPLTNEGVLLGRMLFFDPIMSNDSSISCNSCHSQNKAFTDGRKFSKGIGGQLAVRNSMPLHNLMWNKKFFWDGRVTTLQQQVLFPIQAHNEMNMNLYDLVIKLQNSKRYSSEFKKAFNTNTITPNHVSKALEQFLVTMISFNSKFDQLKGRTDTLNLISASALRGLNLFMTPIEEGGADCFHCHANLPFLGKTSAEGSMANNGLDMVFTDNGFGNFTGNNQDNGKFKIPNLRNVEMTAPYMHDGRFDNLEEVLDFYSDNIKLDSPNLDENIASHNKQLNLTAQQKEDIIEFLKTLTDTEFLNNPAFKTPFQ